MTFEKMNDKHLRSTVRSNQNLDKLYPGADNLSVDAQKSFGPNIRPSGPISQDFSNHSYYYLEKETSRPFQQHGVFISYDDQNPVAVEVFEQLRTQLEETEKNLAVFVAPQCSISSEELHKDCYIAMGLSHAAVILLSANTVRLDAIHKVVRLLAVRQLSHVESFNFIIVPVLLDSTPDTLDFIDSKFTSLNWKNFSPIVGGDPSTICTQVLAKLKPLKRMPYETSLAVLGRIIGEEFRHKKVNADDLNFILSFFTHELENDFDLCTQIGWAMWKTNVFSIKNLFDHLLRVLDKETQSLFNLLSPSWIDPWAAHWIPEAAERPPGKRAIVFNYLGDMNDKQSQSYVEFTIRSFVRRAYCSWLGPGFILDLRNYSADGCGTTSLINNVREEINLSLFNSQLPSIIRTSSEWENYVKRKIEQRGPIFIIMYLPDSPGVVKLMETFRYATFLFLTGQEFSKGATSLHDVILLQPPLVAEDIYISWEYYLSAIGYPLRRSDNG